MCFRPISRGFRRMGYIPYLPYLTRCQPTLHLTARYLDSWSRYCSELPWRSLLHRHRSICLKRILSPVCSRMLILSHQAYFQELHLPWTPCRRSSMMSLVMGLGNLKEDFHNLHLGSLSHFLLCLLQLVSQ